MKSFKFTRAELISVLDNPKCAFVIVVDNRLNYALPTILDR